MLLAAQSDQSFSTRRNRRRMHVRRRAFSMLAELLRDADPINLIGPDRMFREVATQHGLEASSIAAYECYVRSGFVSFIGVLNAVWYDPPQVKRLQQTISRFSEMGGKAVVLPQRAIEGLSIAAAPDRLKVLAELIEFRDETREHACARTFHVSSGCRATILATGRVCLL